MTILRRIFEPVTYDSRHRLVFANIKHIMLYNVGIDVQLQQKSTVRGVSQGKQRRPSACEVDTTNIVLLKEEKQRILLCFVPGILHTSWIFLPVAFF